MLLENNTGFVKAFSQYAEDNFDRIKDGEHQKFLDAQIAHHERSVKYNHKIGNEKRALVHEGVMRNHKLIFDDIEKIRELIEYLPELNARLKNMHDSANKGVEPLADASKVGNRLGDISELPEELRAQLVSVQFDKKEGEIVEVLKSKYGGVATIDEILVGLYHHTGEIDSREQLATKIYRMVRKEILYSVEGRKGVYSTSPMKAEEERESQS